MNQKILSMVEHWELAATIRALKTAAQTAIGVIGASTVMGDVSWPIVGSAVLLSVIVSYLTSLAGLPEVDDGKSFSLIHAAAIKETKQAQATPRTPDEVVADEVPSEGASND